MAEQLEKTRMSPTPKWSEIIIWSVLLAVALLLAACSSDNRVKEEVAQPIVFNHQRHTVDEEMGCDSCHQHYEITPTSGLPKIAVCAECHTAGHAESDEGVKVDELSDSGTEIPWVRMYEMPSHVVFDHSAHTAAAQIECTTCHGDTGTSTRPTRYRDFGNTGRWLDFVQRENTMNWCMECHEDRLASTDCLICHQ